MQNRKNTIPQNKLDNRSLAGKAADFIREQIIQGNFEQGSRLVEEDLSDSLGVNRACIREALIILELEGLVKRHRNKCTQIVKFESNDIEEVFLLRIVLEVLCAETCIAKNTVPYEELKNQLLEIQKIGQLNEKDYMKRVEEDLKFHELFIYASQNTRAITFWKSIRSQMLTMFYAIPKMYSDFFDLHSTENHISIINVFKTGDDNAVVTLLKEHIKLTLELLINRKNGI